MSMVSTIEAFVQALPSDVILYIRRFFYDEWMGDYTCHYCGLWFDMMDSSVELSISYSGQFCDDKCCAAHVQYEMQEYEHFLERRQELNTYEDTEEKAEWEEENQD